MTLEVIALHGFSQTGRSWLTPGRALAALVPELVLHTPDMPGHGSQSAEPLDLNAAADHLAETMPYGIWIGYSMGGRHLLHLAIRHPERCSGLVLMSTTAGIDDDRERAERRASDERTADRILEIGVAAFVEEWTAQPMFAGRLHDDDERASRLTNTADGLAGSLRLAGTGTQIPLWSDLERLDMPTLVIAGSDDHKFTALGERLATSLPNADLHVVRGAGHAVHLERPNEVAAEIARWITQRVQAQR
ncbi:MAG: alpha/beta fold hydrolase [Actinomycetota bacterium]|nr:alpha/beta fold hydrolase [Actinomycetota bacterium]